MKIYIELSSGLVQWVYADGPCEVEVIDTDEGDRAERTEKRDRLEAIKADPNFSAVW